MGMAAVIGNESDISAPWLSDLPPTAFQTWFAIAIAAVVLVAFTCSTCGWRKMLHKRTDFAARPAIQQKTPTDAKNTAAIQTPESESLPVETAIKMISAAIQHTKAIARLHQ
jgi:hypothetical protein